MRLGAISARKSVSGATALAIAGLLVVSGWAIAQGHAGAIFMLVGGVGLCTMAWAQRGAFIGVLLLATMNGLPFIDTSPVVFSK